MTNCNRTYFPSPWAHPASRLFLVGWKEDSFPLTIPALPLYCLPYCPIADVLSCFARLLSY